MDAKTSRPGRAGTGTMHYEVRTAHGLVTLRLFRDGREMAFSTDRSSAVTMASDLLRAVQHLSAREERVRGDRHPGRR